MGLVVGCELTEEHTIAHKKNVPIDIHGEVGGLVGGVGLNHSFGCGPINTVWRWGMWVWTEREREYALLLKLTPPPSPVSKSVGRSHLEGVGCHITSVTISVLELRDLLDVPSSIVFRAYRLFMVAYLRPAARLSASRRGSLRASGESVCKRPRGPKPKLKAAVSDRAKRKRDQKLTNTERIIVGAGFGRCGTTNLAANLQNQGFRVTHEAGNTNSVDYRRAVKDKFTLRSATPEVKARHAKALVADLLAFGAGARVVGDLSHVHSQVLQEVLDADERVHVAFQYRRCTRDWLTSVLAHSPRPGLPETLLLRGWGIASSSHGERLARLRAFKVAQLRHARQLQKQYPTRLHLVELGDLSIWGQAFVTACGGQTAYSASLGRNARSLSREGRMRLER